MFDNNLLAIKGQAPSLIAAQITFGSMDRNHNCSWQTIIILTLVRFRSPNKYKKVD